MKTVCEQLLYDRTVQPIAPSSSQSHRPVRRAVTLNDANVSGLDSFQRFSVGSPLPDASDAHSLGFEFALKQILLDADVTFRSYPLKHDDTPDSSSGLVFVHPRAAPLELTFRSSVSADEIGASGALMLALNSSALGHTALWQLARPACLSRALLAAGLRYLAFDWDATAAYLRLAPSGADAAEGPTLLRGFTRFVNDAAAVGLAAFPHILDRAVSGAARGPLVSAVNFLAADLLSKKDLRPPSDICAATPPPVLQRADWRSHPDPPDLLDLASHFTHWLDAGRVSEALRVIGLSGLYLPGALFSGDSDFIFMSQMGLGTVEMTVCRDLSIYIYVSIYILT